MSAWPGSAENVAAWMRESLRGQREITGLEATRIEVALDGTDLDLFADATGVEVLFSPDGAEPDVVPGETPIEPEPASSSPGTLRTARIVAQPLRVQGFDLTVDIAARQVPIVWREYDEPIEAGRAESTRSIDLGDLRSGEAGGTALVGMRHDDIAPLIRAVLQPLLDEAGVALRRCDVRVRTRGELVQITVDAAARWKLIGGSARLVARVRVGRDGVVTLEKVALRSANPLIAGALLLARRPLSEIEGQSVDLNEELVRETGRRLIGDLRVEAGDEVRVSARFG